jgi:flavin reductase (DIM6/NTAB) family NADH-FMN oxidoreductase RutF
MGFSSIRPRDIRDNVFEMIGDHWLLLTAGDRDSFNTMTASWGALGVMWNLDVATCYVRPQRYTYEFMERGDYYTLSFYGEEFHDMLAFCGANSGRDTDKAAVCGLTPALAACGAPYFEEASLVLVCKKLYYGDIDPKGFVDSRVEQSYPAWDYHRMYLGEIVEVLKKD